MPRIKQARVRSFLGEVYFVPMQSDDEALAILLATENIGRDSLSPSGNGFGDGDNDEDDLSGARRSTFLRPTLPGPSVRARVTNGYTGPVTSDAGVFGEPTVRALVTTASTRQFVGHPLMIYKIPQIVQVTYAASLAFGGQFLDNYPLNRTDFRMVRGVQNEINFYVRDVDRKSVPLAFSESLTINIVDMATNTLLMSRNLTIIDNTQGIYLLTVLPAEMDTWPTTSARWSLSYNRADGSTVLMWTDRAYSPYSTCKITEGPVPGPTAAIILQSDDLTMLDGRLYSPAMIGAAMHGYIGGAQSFFITTTAFTGAIRIDASLVTTPTNDNVSTDWFQVDMQSYVDNTSSVLLNEVGDFLWLRVVVTQVAGMINQIQYKS